MTPYKIVSYRDDTYVPVYPSGFKFVKDLVRGDKLIGIDGQPAKVTKIGADTASNVYTKIHLPNPYQSLVVGLVKQDPDEPIIRHYKRQPIAYESIDVMPSITTKTAWFARGVTDMLPDSFTHNDRLTMMETLAGFMQESGCYVSQHGVYAFTGHNRDVTYKFRQLLAALGIDCYVNHNSVAFWLDSPVLASLPYKKTECDGVNYLANLSVDVSRMLVQRTAITVFHAYGQRSNMRQISIDSEFDTFRVGLDAYPLAPTLISKE